MCVALAGFGLSVQAQNNALAVVSNSIAQGGEVDLSISLENESPISGGQFTVTLPQGVSVKDVVLNSERSNGHTVEYRWNETKRSLLILLYAQPTATLKGNDGVLCTLSLSAAEEATAGDFPVTLGDVRLAMDAVTQTGCTTTEGMLTIIARYEIIVDAAEGGTADGGGIFDADASVVLTATPDEGYHFVRWSDGSTANPYVFNASEDVSLAAEFAPNVYRVIYMVDGMEYRTEEVLYGSTVSAIAAPVKEGHTFGGWSSVPATMPAKDVTVNGSFTVNSYTVTYMVDGEIYKTESFVYGAAITVAESPVKEGYTFSGWSEIPATMPAGNITISGSFAVNSYTVTFVLEGEVFAEYTLQYGSVIEVPEAPQSEGFTFSGWGKVSETMPARDLVFEGSYMKNPYTIIYIVDGVEYHRASVEYGSVITLIAIPVKEGHTFSGWSEIPATMPAGNITVSGSFAVNSYTVTYMVDGEVYKTESIAYGSKVTVIAAPAKEGHTFSGWSGVPATMPAKDVTVNGSFTVNSYTVTYMVDGEVFQTVIVTYGAAITLIDTPTKEGYTFSGWTDVPGTMPAHDVTINGRFVTDAYTVTYMVDGEVYKTENIAYGSKVEAIAVPVKEGHTFSGWSEIPELMPAYDVTISGTFTVNKYLVTFKIDDEVIAADSLEYGAIIVVPEAPEKEGYTFDGWKGMPVTVPAKDLIIEGKYAAKEYLLTFIIDGALYEMRKVRCDEEIAPLDVTEKEGHTLIWENWKDTMPAKDYTIRGKYTPNNYAVIYKVDGVMVRTDSIAYGTPFVLCEEPVKEGYTFSGWSKVPETMPAEDVTVSGIFTVNKYLVTFKIGDEVIAVDSLEYGAIIVAPEAPEKEGHAFSGWGEVAETVPAGDVTYEGSYIVNIYKVYYYVDEELVHTAEVAYGEAIPEYAYEPTKEDEIFEGWVGETYETMPAHDVTYVANITNDVLQLTVDNSRLTNYDLTGRKVTSIENLKGGIYIVNGRKVVIK